MMSFKTLVAIIVIGGTSACGMLQNETRVFVSTSGNDSNPGTKRAPVKSLVVARDLVRGKRVENSSLRAEIMHIILGEGNYTLDETLVLEPIDSNLVIKSSEGTSPTVVGGRTIKGWKPLTSDSPAIRPEAKGKLLTAEVPKGWLFHYLFINGQRAERSKSDHRYWREWNKDHSSAEMEPRKPHLITLQENKHLLKHLPNNGDVEMLCIMAQYGVMANGVVTDIDTVAGSLRWNTKAFEYRDSRHSAERGYRFENALSLIDRPGEWAVDSEKGIVYYYPKAGEEATNIIAIAPKLNRLLHLKGNEASHQIVRNITIDGITFAYTDRLREDQWPDNWLCRQWENVDAALYFEGVEHCKVINSRILHSGSYGIAMKHHAQHNLISHNEIGWTGSGGIFLEGYGPGTLDVNKYNMIERNYIHDHGLGNYWHSPCVQIYQSGHNTIRYNLLQRSAYSSISIVGMHYKYMGWPQYMSKGSYRGMWHEWSYFRPRLEDFPKEIQEGIKNETYKFDRETMKPYIHSNKNIVERNVFSEPHTKLNEGGVIYAWCHGKGGVWKENVIFKSGAMPGSSILALDDVAEYTTVTGNVIWIDGVILNGVGARSTERGVVVSGNYRVNYKPEHKAKAWNPEPSEWVQLVTGREPLDSLLHTITTEVEQMGGWLGNPEIGVPKSGETVTKYGNTLILPEGANVTIEE